MKEKFDRNTPHKNIKDIIPKEHTNFDSVQAALNYVDYLRELLRERYIEECVKNGEKPRFADSKDYQDIDMNDVFNDLVIEFQEAIRCNNKMKVDFYGRKIIANLVNLGYSKEAIFKKINELIPTDKDLSIIYPIEDNNKIK